jgi:hypothetical protein
MCHKDYWDMVRDREAAEAGRQADRKEAADRMYEKVKKEMEDEMRRWASGLVNDEVGILGMGQCYE